MEPLSHSTWCCVEQTHAIPVELVNMAYSRAKINVTYAAKISHGLLHNIKYLEQEEIRIKYQEQEL
jgi:hypothetical protein